MKLISNNLRLAAALVASLLCFATVAKALPTQVAYSPVLTQPSSNGVGFVTTWVNESIATFNANSYAGSPLPTTLGTLLYDIPQGAANPLGGGVFTSDTKTITLNLTGLQYIVLSWGGSDIPNDKGTADYLYYVNGATSFTFFSKKNTTVLGGADAGGGLSSIRAWGVQSVPDGGTTALLLGLGLIGAGLLGRKFRK